MITDKQMYEEWERKKRERDKQGWKLHHVCTCGYIATYSENSVLEIYTFPCCPKCAMRNYQAKYRRWISTSIWKKPSTWFSGYYEWEN